MHRVVFFFSPFVSSRFSFGCISLLEQGREKRWLWSRETRKYSVCPCERDVRGVDTWSVNDLLGWRGNYFVPKLSRIEKLFKDVTKVRTGSFCIAALFYIC